ncbi:MAG: hypothetical protein WD029_10925 [Microthrixaceae bacterium]
MLTAWAIAAVGLVVICLRRPSALTDPGLFAEDGAVFWLQSLTAGLSSILEPYNGYLHLLPRLIAAVGSWLPVAATPLFFACASAIVAVSACGLILSQRFAPLIPSYLARILVFALLLLMPRLTTVHLSLNSVLWWCGVALFLSCLADDPSTKSGCSIELAAIAVLVLSGLAGLVLAPLVFLRWWRLRSRHSMHLLIVWWGLSILQLGVYLTQNRQNGQVPLGPPLARSGIEKTFGSLALGRNAIDGRWVTGLPLVLLALLSVFVAVWLIILILGTKWNYSVAILWAATVPIFAGFLALGPRAAVLPDRYTVLPSAAVIIGLVCSAPRPAVLKYLRVAALVMLVTVRVTDFSVPSRPSTQWTESVKCLKEERNQCVVQLNPAGWTVVIPPGVR